MYRFYSVALSLGLILAHAARGGAADDPRAVIAKAIEAIGGIDKASAAKAEQVKVKGVWYEMGGGVKFTGEIITQLPEQDRAHIEFDINGTKMEIIQVLNRNRGWMRNDGDNVDIVASNLTDMKQSAYVDFVAGLAPLLKDKKFALSPLPAIQVQGEAAPGVLVKSAGHPDVSLYFTPESGELMKVSHRRLDPESSAAVLYEEFLSDYREVNASVALEKKLKEAKIAVDTPALLDYLRQRTLNKAKREQILALIEKFGDASFAVREKAKEDVVAFGEPARALLVDASKKNDPEVATRAKVCLKEIGAGEDAGTARAVIGLLVQRQPADVVDVLLAYLPYATEATIAREVRAALAAVAYRDGKPDPALVKAKEEGDPLRRTAASKALEGDGNKVGQPLGRQLFLTGLKRPMKGERFKDGKKTWEWEVQEVRHYNQLDDRIFTKP
jgi:hypothetical protein